MAPTSTPRIIKSNEEKAYLRSMIERGMTGGHATDIVSQAVKETRFSRQNILQFIRNEKSKSYRGRNNSKMDPEKLTLYGGMLCMNDKEFVFDGSGNKLGNLTKAKAAKYQELKKTAQGRKILEENCQKQKEKRMGSQLTDVQKHNRALGCFDRVEKETHILSSLGFKAAMLSSQPTRRPTVMGNPEAVKFLADNTKLMHSFDHQMTNKTGQLTSKERQKLLRGRVQKAFNDLYVKEFGVKAGTPMPYADLELGRLVISMCGLPESVPFKRPSTYTLQELEDILKCSENITICRTTEGKLLIPKPHVAHRSLSEPVLHPSDLPPQPSVSVPDSPESTRPHMSQFTSQTSDQVEFQICEDGSLDLSSVSLPHEPLEVALQKIRTEWKKQQDKDTPHPSEKRQGPLHEGNSALSGEPTTTPNPVDQGSLPQKSKPLQKRAKKRPVVPAKDVHRGEAQAKRTGAKRPHPALMKPGGSSYLAPKPMEAAQLGGVAEKVAAKRVKRLYTMKKEKKKKTTRKWFYGDLKQEEDKYIIEFDLPEDAEEDQEKEVCMMTREEFAKLLKDGVLVLL